MTGALDRIVTEIAACERQREDLRDYQAEKLIPFLRDNPKSAAYVGMGLGKTVSVWTLLEGLWDVLGDEKTLIVAPLRVTTQTWPTELKVWGHLRHLPIQVIRADEKDPSVVEAMRAARAKEKTSDFGSPNHAAAKARTAQLLRLREQCAESDAPFHLINREQFDWLTKYFGKRWPYKNLIIDESTSFSDHQSARWKAATRVRRLCNRIHLLSGVPAPEGVQQLFTQMYLLDGGKRLGQGITAFRNRWMIRHPHIAHTYLSRPGAMEEIAEICSDICMVMKEEDYLPMDKPLLIEARVTLPPPLMKRYREFERDSVLEVAEEQLIEAKNAGALAGKLLQFASGFVYDENKNVHWLHDYKLEALKEIIREAKERNSPVLIAYWFKPSLELLKKEFPKAIAMDKEGSQVDAWNKGKIPILLMHPASGAHGLNMQLGPGHIMAFFDVPMSLELWMQFIKRLARPGQKNLVRVYHIITEGTYDLRQLPRLLRKEINETALRDLLAHYRRQRA